MLRHYTPYREGNTDYDHVGTYILNLEIITRRNRNPQLIIAVGVSHAYKNGLVVHRDFVGPSDNPV